MSVKSSLPPRRSPAAPAGIRRRSALRACLSPGARFAAALTLAALCVSVLGPGAMAASARKSASQPEAPSAPSVFLELPADHALASMWNDPDFQRRLMGGYGFLSEAEPRMTPEEQQFYNEKLKPLLQEDPPRAIPLLESRLKPGATAQFDYLLGTVLFQNQDLTNAIQHFETALAKFPDFRRAQKNLALARMAAGQYQEAIPALTRTILLGGADGRIYGLLAFAFMNQGRHASAEGAYLQALVFEPENTDFKLGLVKCAIATANHDRALALLEELLRLYPDRDSLWALQANLFIQKGQPAQAVVSLEMLRRLGKATAQHLVLLGDLHLAQESRALALAAYLEAVAKDGNSNAAKALRPAQLLVSRGAWEEARALFATLRAPGVTLSAEDQLTLLRLEAKVALSAGQADKAIVTLEQILERNPLDGEALLLAGDYYARAGQPEKAEFRYDAASKLEGFEADACVKRAQVLVQSRKWAQAAELLQRAQRVKPRESVQRYLERIEQLALGGRS